MTKHQQTCDFGTTFDGNYPLRVIESRLEGGVDRRKLKFTTLNTLQAGVSVRIKSESEREEENKSTKK